MVYGCRELNDNNNIIFVFVYNNRVLVNCIFLCQLLY